jgi:hypothetical protein
MKYAGLRGVNSAEFPVLNDISEQAFKDNKLANVAEFEKLFLGEALERFGLEKDHYEDKDKVKRTAEISEEVNRYLPPRELRKKYKLSEYKIKQIREAHPEIVLKVGNGFRYHEGKLIDLFKFEGESGVFQGK